MVRVKAGVAAAAVVEAEAARTLGGAGSYLAAHCVHRIVQAHTKRLEVLVELVGRQMCGR